MKTRARSIKNVDENTNQTTPPKDRIRGYSNSSNGSNTTKSPVKNGIRVNSNSPTSKDNSMMMNSSSPPVLTNNVPRRATEEQTDRMVLITTVLSGWSGTAAELFEVNTWKELIKKYVEGDSLMERRYKQEARLTQFANVIIEQITSPTFRQTVYQILATNRGKKDKNRAQEFLTLCEEYEAKKTYGDPSNDSYDNSTDSSRDQSYGGFETDEGENYVGPLLYTEELGKLDSTVESDEGEINVVKENGSTPIPTRRRRGNIKGSIPLGFLKNQDIRRSHAYSSPRVSRERDISHRYPLNRQCKVELNVMMCNDSLPEIKIGQKLTAESLVLPEPQDVDNDYILGLPTEDEFIENETPPSTPLDGTDISDQLTPVPLKKRKLTRENKDLNPNACIKLEPVFKGEPRSPVRGNQVVGTVGGSEMIDKYTNGYDYLSLIDDSEDINGGDDEEQLPDLTPPEQGKDNKENFPKSEQDIACYYPKPPSGPELKPYMFDEMQEALMKPRKEKIVSAFKITINQEHLAVYNKAEWLEDRNIDFYLEMIQHRNNRPSSRYPKVYIFQSFFYKLLEKGVNDSSTRGEDIFKYDLLLIPIHSSHHWILGAVNFGEKTLTCYDSMDHDNKNHLKIIEKFLVREYKENKRLRKETLESGIGNNLTSISDNDSDLDDEWQIIDRGAESIPQQTNGRDCGVFCLQFAEYLSRRQEFDFEQRHTAYFRRRMLYETLKKSLLIQ